MPPPLSKEQFENEIKLRKIFYFSCPELNTDVPHYFICFSIHPVGVVNLSCCTSQFETVKKLIERGRLPYETLVYIPKEFHDNPFTLDTYVNCNEFFSYYVHELWDMYNKGELKLIDELLPLESFVQMIIGFNSSDLIEQELKDSLPNQEEL